MLLDFLGVAYWYELWEIKAIIKRSINKYPQKDFNMELRLRRELVTLWINKHTFAQALIYKIPKVCALIICNLSYWEFTEEVGDKSPEWPEIPYGWSTHVKFHVTDAREVLELLRDWLCPINTYEAEGCYPDLSLAIGLMISLQ